MSMRSIVAALTLLLPMAVRAAADPGSLKAAAGFKVWLYTDQVPNARELALGDRGTVFVGSREAGKVYAVTDGGKRVRVIASGLQMPVGVAFHNGDLYLSAVSRILRLPDIEAQLDHPPAPQVLTDRLPDATHHGWRFIAFGPDGKLYVPIGAPCNVCDKPGYAKLIRMNADGSDWQDVAYGIRNTVGFDWQPTTGKLWFTDNGRDMLGDDLPSDELNRVDHAGQHFGFPYCHQGDTPDPDFGVGHPCAAYTPPVFKLGAHVAAIGMRFYEGAMFPRYRGAVFIAEHGSWNRSQKVGYRVDAVRLDGDGKPLGQDVILDGFLGKTLGMTTVRGRPADVQPLPDGSLLVSDDQGGAIYRLSAR